MTRIRKLCLLAILVLAAPVALAACGGGDDVDPEQVLRDTFGNDEQVTSGTIDITIDGSVEGGETPGSGDATLSGSFQGDEADPTALPQLDLTGSANFEAGGVSGGGEGGLIVTSDNAYIEFGGATYEVGTELFSAFRDQFAAAAAMGATGTEGATAASFDEQCATLLEQAGGNTAACEEIDVFSWFELSDEGEEEIEGTNTRHIQGTVDVSAMIDNLNAAIEASEIPDATPITEEQKAQAEEAVSELTFDVYSGTEDNLLRGLDVNVTIDPSGIGDFAAENPGVTSISGHLGTRLGAVNEPQTIEAPTDAQPLDDLLSQYGLDSSALESQLGVMDQLGIGGVGSTDLDDDLGSTDDLGGGGGGGLGGGGGSGGGGGGGGNVDDTLAQLYLACIAEAKNPQELQDCESLAP